MHEELKKIILENPKLLNLEGVLAYKEEVPYALEGKKAGQVDIVIWDRYGQPYLVELTAANNQRAKRRNRRQARRARRYFHFPAFSITVKTNGNLEITKFE